MDCAKKEKGVEMVFDAETGGLVEKVGHLMHVDWLKEADGTSKLNVGVSWILVKPGNEQLRASFIRLMRGTLEEVENFDATKGGTK